MNEQPKEELQSDDETLEGQVETSVENEAASTDEAFAEAGEETRDEEMIRLRGEVDEANKRVLQAQAEAENFRKRMRRDTEDQLKFASMPLVNDILQVRDNLLRAIEAASAAGDAESSAGLSEGVSMVCKQLDDVLAKHGIKEIPAQGELFDPNFHEAISQMPHPEIASGMVAHVATPGFQMHERVVRPAQVVVSTGDGSA
ncbi:nucleotide exchange factor GrpE [Rhodopirellula halodulae]|uniref:nucleotide exchange factor GrpE n=1 Tax=Rhodopirellula halodulae TaxID=2894198 RepID=UPI001E503500|nr:nucleotide exchange factor GrpE [Rhodopirellula sp. JC737]MCC9656989.1 nucleotide exchange factor GrpE [Rhodopirellula sp. JC737]